MPYGIKIGTRVKLLQGSGYSHSPRNPEVGSEHECCGVVSGHDSMDIPNTYGIRVAWDNGFSNNYKKGDLITAEEPMVHNMIVGSIVKLKKRSTFVPTMSNPKIGSKYECEGKVVFCNNSSVEVAWSNGRNNDYSYNDLELVEESTDGIKKGDKVKLLETASYVPTANNPKIGSKYECEGEVYSYSSYSGIISVVWENGTSNTYSKGDLEVSDHGYCISMW